MTVQFYGRYGHVESNFFNKTEALEASSRKHNINLDSSSNSSFQGNGLYTFGFSFIASYTYYSNERLIDFG